MLEEIDKKGCAGGKLDRGREVRVVECGAGS